MRDLKKYEFIETKKLNQITELKIKEEEGGGPLRVGRFGRV